MFIYAVATAYSIHLIYIFSKTALRVLRNMYHIKENIIDAITLAKLINARKLLPPSETLEEETLEEDMLEEDMLEEETLEEDMLEEDMLEEETLEEDMLEEDMLEEDMLEEETLEEDMLEEETLEEDMLEERLNAYLYESSNDDINESENEQDSEDYPETFDHEYAILDDESCSLCSQLSKLSDIFDETDLNEYILPDAHINVFSERVKTSEEANIAITSSTTDVILDIFDEERDFIDSEKEHGRYYLGSYFIPDNPELYINPLLLSVCVQPTTFFKYSYDDIIVHVNQYSPSPKPLEIMQVMITNTNNYTYVNVILKTFWLKIVQRRWKKIYSNRQHITKSLERTVFDCT
jgi:hypothetical protein